MLGRRGVIIGDAACTVPPWAGYGANTAMYSAAILVTLLARHADTQSEALAVYATHIASLSASLMSFVFDQGDFLAGPVVTDPAGRSDDALAGLILAARQPARLADDEVTEPASVGSEPRLA